MKSSGLSTFTRVVVLSAFYLVGAMLGKASAFMPGNISLVWPPAGIALAAILLFGYRFWPGVAAGSLLCSFTNGEELGLLSIASAVGNTTGAVVCAYLLDRFVHFRPSMERVQDVAGFVLLACFLGTTLNALFEAASFYVSGSLAWEHLFDRAVDRWVPNALGTLVVAPAILVWTQATSVRWRRPLILEAALCLAGLLATTILSFNSWYFYGVQNYPLAFLPYPFLVWSALRFGQRGAITATLVTSILAIDGLLQGLGPFAAARIQTSLVLLGCYIGVLAVTNLLLAASAAEKKAALRQTMELQERFRAVVEDQTDLLCRFDRSGNITFVNDAYCRFHRKTAHELAGSNFFGAFSKDDREIPFQTFLSLSPSNPVFRYDIRVIPPKGVPLWQQCTIRALFTEDQQIREFQAVIQDITQRKESEEAARLAAERLRAIMDSMVDGIIIVDEKGLIVSANPAAEQIFQRQTGPWLQTPARALFDNPEAYDAYLSRRQEARDPEIVELSVRRPGGNWIPVDLAASAIFHGGLRIDILVVRDITERKRMEEQFRQSQKMEAIGRLAGGIAHDFNNLLQAMLGDCNLLSHRLPTGDPNRNSVEQIQKTMERARALIQQLLAFSRKQSPTPKVLALNAAVTEMHQLLKRLISYSITIEFHLDPHPLCVRAEPGQLEQIILNLSINARDAMPDGGLLTIETGIAALPRPDAPSTLTAGSYAVLTITDTGHGIPPEIMPRLFEPFFTTKEADKGTGLGLSIAQSAIQKNGGAITVASEPGRGTRFVIYLPMAGLEELEAAPQPVANEIARGRETILLVEDEELVLLMLTELLKAEGYTVLDAANGSAALNIAKNHAGPIDLLVTDLSMPGVTGWELASRLQELGRSMPVLYMSGYSDEEVNQRGELVNCADFLQKPFQPRTLLVKMRQILEGRKTG